MGTWIPSSSKIPIIFVYAPRDLTEKRVLWDYILRLIDRWDGDCVIMGDFNEVRIEQERYGSVFNIQGANAFNSFISLASLADLTFDDTWKSLATVDSNGMINLKKKLQALKIVIKQWTKNAKKSSYKAKITIQSKLSDIAKILDQGNSNEEILSDRSLLLKELNDINSIDSLEAAQKSKVRWAIEGDENTKFFHVSNARFGSLGISYYSSLTLSYFYLADDANLSLDKCKLMGIGTRLEEVDAVATTMGCLIFTTPFVHLGVKWSALFTKAIYGEGRAPKFPNFLSKRTPWFRTLFVRDDLALKHKFLRLYALDNYKQITIVKKNNDASMVDTFHRPPRGGAEEEHPIFLLSRMDGLILTNVRNRWVSSLEATSKFSVKSIR
ncbi:RNA-directed DNA polymerase, eukaryota [Tanacetum coccineum]